MPSRKRSLREAESAPSEIEQRKEASLIDNLRNSFYFANLYQWICIFGKVVKVDDNLDIADLEAECLKHGSMALQEIGLSLLKHISSHRGLSHALFDEYTRRQFSAKFPNKKNPFGKAEVAARFADFDLMEKLRVLWLMTQMVMMKPEHIRPNMDEQKNDEQTAWRIEPYGWDRKDREYYVLDDNRLYRLTQAPAPSAPPKKTSQKAKAAARAAKRRRIAVSVAADSTNDEDNASEVEDNDDAAEIDDNQDPLGGATWECVAITLDEVRNFIEPLKKSKDPNEKVLRSQIEEHMLPLLEKQEESRKRKILQRERELLNLAKMANAKRSSRLAGRAEQQRQEEQEREERQKRLAEEAAAKKEEQKRLKIEKERDNRLMSREKRLRERETRRLQHEEELAQLSEGSKSTEAGRLSERRLKAEIEKNKQALQELEEEETEWVFDCICGLHGQVDDGEHSVACERCNVWQHSKCLGIDEAEAEREDFHFICKHCQKAERNKTEPQPKHSTKIKLKLKDATSAAPSSNKPVSTTPIPLPQYPGMSPNMSAAARSKPAPQSVPPQLADVSLPSTSASSSARVPEPSPQKHSSPPVASNNSFTAPFTSGPSLPPPSSVFPSRKPSMNGLSHNPFSSPHPNLLPPDLSPNKSRAYGSIYNSSSPAAHDVLETAQGSTDRPPLSLATANAVSSGQDSATKEAATKNSSSVTSPLKPAQTPFSASKVLDQSRSSPSPLATPRLNPTRPEDNDPLPSSRGGISPTKHSPLPRSGSSTYNNTGDRMLSSPAPAVMPPVASLSPTPQKTDLTPPVKIDEPVRPMSQHSTLFHSSPMQSKPHQE
ncbi:hypothetical protein N0V93_003468 [Gnomoniopsis smithogilvyi]|uniref:Zinc finger PHD-type domain-containing protein n=1 Tax=Gnomoniopsis smithogilvyi TaxID=1191159 RepID=A0A9W8YYH9_9PEZI|nr:hypothetical protein N0V93_003468 [Gnomoniopsis smithogilvyi]